VYNAEIYAREVAPLHHHIVEALLAVLAVALEDEDARFAEHFDARQHAQLHHVYRHSTTSSAAGPARNSSAAGGATPLL